MELSKIVLVMGKGGVGKSTVARGLADGYAQRGERVVVLELGTGAAPRKAGRGSAAHRSISEEGALYETAGEIFGSERVVRFVFGNFAVKRVMAVIPGVREYCLVVAARRCLAEFDRVVVDMPATGHGIAWLSAARQLSRLVPSGRARAQADALDAALRDPAETSYVLVSLPEPLVLSESAELERALSDRLGVRVSQHVINRVPSAVPIDDAELRALAHSDPTLWREVLEMRAWNEALRAARSCAEELAGRGDSRIVPERPARLSAGELLPALGFQGGV
jgi:arsenite/tail-anchored protein-transporting ATPase